MNKKGGMSTWQLVLIALAILGLLGGMIYAAKTKSITDTIKSTTDKWSIYKNSKNLFTIEASQKNNNYELAWVVPEKYSDIKKYKIYVTTEDLSKKADMKFFTESSVTCTGPNDNRRCKFSNSKYYSGDSLVNMETGRYDVLIESLTERDKLKGTSRRVLNYVKRSN